jgi:glycosyltransferase involved in cell wall biosynthesis
MRSDWGGIERYVAYLADECHRRGVAVGVAAAPGSPLASNLAAPQYAVGLGNKYDLRALGPYLRALRAGGFAAMVTHFSRDYLVPALAARMARVPALLTRHVAVPIRPSSARVYQRLYRGYVGVSETVAATLASVSLGPRTAAHPGVPDPGERPPVPWGRPRIAFVGRLVAEKGPGVAVAAAELTDADWELVGEGPLLGPLARSAGPNVRFLGRVADPAAIVAACHAVVVPSVWQEAFGLVAVEAMALGRAVLASRVGGLAEIVEDGVSGLLVPPGEARALAEAVGALDESVCRRMGRAGREAYAARFTVAAMADRTLAAYAGLLGR